MARTSPHKIDTNSKNVFRSIIDSNKYCDALTRDVTERDYGIDFIVELFEDGNPTGMISFIQLKGTQKKLESLKNSKEVSCSGISRSSLPYGKQRNVPYIIVYLSIESNEFYFVDLQSIDISTINNGDSKSVTIRMPNENRCNKDNIEKFINIIKSYYN